LPRAAAVSDTDVTRAFGRSVETMLKTGLPHADVFYAKVTRPDNEPLWRPYVVIWLIPASWGQVDFAGCNHVPDLRFQLTGVGRDPDEVATVLDRSADALLGRRGTLPGWRPGQIKNMPTHAPVTKNEDLWTPQHTPTYRSWSMFKCTADRNSPPDRGS
jgi:hypothetical protein